MLLLDLPVQPVSPGVSYSVFTECPGQENIAINNNSSPGSISPSLAVSDPLEIRAATVRGFLQSQVGAIPVAISFCSAPC